jgi:hypothetical protein
MAEVEPFAEVIEELIIRALSVCPSRHETGWVSF